MSKVRFKFNKTEKVKFISHLDMMRAFERAFRRAKIKLLYSTGFNPHPKLVFGLPLPVGVTSECEYGEVEIEDSIDAKSFLETLNKSIPEGLRIIEASIDDSKDNVMKLVTSAEYRITVKLIEADESKVEDFFSQEQIFVEKRTKKGMKNIDIKPLIIQYKLSLHQEDTYIINTKVLAGNEQNLRPDLLFKALEEYLNNKIGLVGICRTKLYLA